MDSNPNQRPDQQKDGPLCLQGRRLSSKFSKLKDLCLHQEISLRILIVAMEDSGLALVTLIFSLPFLLPVPLPGLSVIFGVVIFLAGWAMTINKSLFLPDKLLNKKISGGLLAKIFDKGIKVCKILEKVIRPRGVTILSHPWSQRINGTLITTCGLLLALPLPPGTNFPPATAIILFSIGIIEEDILFILLGHCVFFINLFLFGGMILLGAKGINMLLPFGQ